MFKETKQGLPWGKTLREEKVLTGLHIPQCLADSFLLATILMR